MQKIISHLWFDGQAEEAAAFYTSIIADSEIGRVTRYESAGAQVSGQSVGQVMTVEFKLGGQTFIALNGGPQFKFTPAISLFVNGENREEVDGIWEKLVDGGFALMELGEYPFSERFGWVQDKYGLSWQVNLAPRKQKITPCLMFVGKQHGKAEEAMRLYTSLLADSGIVELSRYGEGEGGDEGTVKQAVFTLQGQEFIAMDSGLGHSFTFSEAISLFVNCTDQVEVDELWAKLSADGEKGNCGWLKDRFGVSWQIVPTALGEMLGDSDPAKVHRVVQAMLQMDKLDVEGLRRAYAGE